MSVIISQIVAMSSNRVIGRDNDLPWHISEDLKFFKRTTMGKPIIMGRKNYESIGRALPGRANLVVSRTMNDDDHEGIEVVDNLETAIKAATAVAGITGTDEVMIIGGGEIYKAALPQTTRIYLTEVHAEIDGDIFFPELGPEWQEVERSDLQTDTKSGLTYTWVILERK